MAPTDIREPLVQVRNLKKYFNIKRKGLLHAVDDVSFDIYPGETLGLVGESGCGKSTIGNVMIRLHEPTAGQMLFNGVDAFALKGQKLLDFRKKAQIIFQDPYSSLNPKKRIRSILSDTYKIHHIASGAELENLLDALCERTGIARYLLDCYPHELDGGKRQIVGIARALSLNPSLIICDEPVSSLDVSIQAKIINLLIDLQRDMHLSYLFISHDLSVVRHISNRIIVMYLGKVVEMADTDALFEKPVHPYTMALLSAVPNIDVDSKIERIVLKGDVPSPLNPKPGCRFAPRCFMAQEKCFQDSPELVAITPGHFAACHFVDASGDV